MQIVTHKLWFLKRNTVLLDKSISGIYALLYQNEVIYVGQGSSIRNRLLYHMNWNGRLNELEKRDRSCKSTALKIQRYEFIRDHYEEIDFLFLEEKDQSQRNALEEHYIHKYKPRFNYAGVYCKYVPV